MQGDGKPSYKGYNSLHGLFSKVENDLTFKKAGSRERSIARLPVLAIDPIRLSRLLRWGKFASIEKLEQRS